MRVVGLLIVFLLSFASSLHVSAQDEIDAQTRGLITQLFPEATEIRPKLDEPEAWPVYQVTELIGYAFLSQDYVSLPGFSGAPYQVMIGVDRDGLYRGAQVIDHHEPIFLHGLGFEPVVEFTAQYPDLDIRQPIKITSATVRNKGSGSNVYVDGITKATISAVVLNETIMLSALKMAEGAGIIPKRKPESIANTGLFTPATWSELEQQNLIYHLNVNDDEIADAFASSPEQSEEGDVSLNYAYLNTPTTGRNILGQPIFERLMSDKLLPGEHAFLIANTGSYSVLGPDFTPGTPSDRLALEQNDVQYELRDLDFFSVVDLPDLDRLEGEGMPSAHEFRIFRVPAGSGFNPAEPWRLSVVMSREINPLVPPEVKRFSADTAPQANLFMLKPAPPEPPPIWVGIWQSKIIEISLLLCGLVVLTLIILRHAWVTANPSRFRVIRWSFLLFTLLFIGYLTQAQLSITNLFMVINVFKGEASASVLLLDPILFLVAAYTLLTVFIWGRGYFCGWLCPFGIYQEIVGTVAKQLKVKQIRIPFSLHARLWRIKYLILAALVLLSFWSITWAERAAEVEPFKTAVTLHFVREPMFVVYAIFLLVGSLFIHKLFCRYLCPLGALLSVLGRFPLLKWLPRRAECGSPCKLCNHRCGIDAIEPSGKINYGECIQCYDCEVIYRDAQQCVPLINAAKGKRALIARSA